MLSDLMRGPRRAAVVLLTSSLPAICGASIEVPGSTAGQFAVQSGAATYSVPLAVPPGLGEMKPELSLV